MYYFIINPASRSGKGQKIWNNIEKELIKREVPYQAVLSHTARSIPSLTAEITKTASKENPVTLIILGGDGTVNEVLCGITDFQYVTLGYIPTGSSNDLARDLSIPSNPQKALDVILSSHQITKMDVGTLTYDDIPSAPRHFCVSCGIGFDAAVCYHVNHSRSKQLFNKIGLGKLIYLWIALCQIFSAPKVSCNMYLNDNPVPIRLPNFLAIISMIHQYEGGGFKFCPHADYSDGIFSICSIGDLPKWKILTCLPTAFFGTHYMVKEIQAYSADTIRLQTSLPLFVHTDGEVMQKSSSITLTCHKQAINFITVQ